MPESSTLADPAPYGYELVLDLHGCNPRRFNRKDIDDYFTELVETHDNFHYHQAISRERQEDGSKGLYVGQMIDKKYDDVFGPILTSDRGLMYLCGLLGMQFGIYQLFAERGITDAYMTIKDELKDIPCSEWNREQMRRYVKPTHRMMVEVY